LSIKVTQTQALTSDLPETMKTNRGYMDRVKKCFSGLHGRRSSTSG